MSPRSSALWGRAIGAAFLLLLHVVVFDMITTFLWVVGFAIFGSALFGLVREVRGGRWAPLWLACSASVLLFPASCVNQAAAWGRTMRRVEALGEQAQALCDARRRCPDVQTLCGGPDCGTAGTTVRHRVRYTVNEDGSRFSVGARLNIDSSVSARGGVGLPLRREHWSSGEDLLKRDGGPPP